MSGLPFKVIVRNLDIPELKLDGPVSIAKASNLFLERVLHSVRFCLGLLVFRLDSAS